MALVFGGSALVVAGLSNAGALNTRHKMAKFRILVSCMRIEINYQAKNLETAICEAIVIYLGYGMPACEIIDQLISRGFIRDPGDNAREDIVQRPADIGEQMRRERQRKFAKNRAASKPHPCRTTTLP